MAQVPEYAEWRPVRPLIGYVACTWAGRFGADGSPYVPSVLPDGCLDIVWDGQSAVRGRTRHRTGAPHPCAREGLCRHPLPPGRAPAFLHAPASALRDLRVDAVEVLDDRALPLADQA